MGVVRELFDSSFALKFMLMESKPEPIEKVHDKIEKPKKLDKNIDNSELIEEIF